MDDISKMIKMLKVGTVILGLLLCVIAFQGIEALIRDYRSADSTPQKPAVEAVAQESEASAVEGESVTEEVTEASEVAEEVVTDSGAKLTVSHTEQTLPAKMIRQTDICVNGQILAEDVEYQPKQPIEFGMPEDYTQLEGVITFRGNNWRNAPTYGFANMTEFDMESIWTHNTTAMEYEGKMWSGNGWTGQPLIVKWPKETRAHMNMYDWAKEKEDLVEVIYAGMGGYIYFLDLYTGEQTRDDLYLGYTFKGAGALDPRGYPIMYLGSGYDSARGKSHAFIINLLDCSIMYEFGAYDPFSNRGSLSFFDSSALVDAETDTLIYPGESGILYLIHLNSQYDEAKGTLSIDPDDVVKWRYESYRSDTGQYWLGMEDSAVIYQGYLYISDNGGHFMCLNLNTLQLEWVQDILDDANGTPVMSWENDHLYIYVGPSFHLGWRSSYSAPVPLFKLDAETGEIVWKHEYICYSDEGVSGGIQSTVALGTASLDDYVYVTVAKTDSGWNGLLACLRKDTGEMVWEHKGAYTWSSPLVVCNANGSARVIYITSDDKIYMLDGATGEVSSMLSPKDGTIEASPAVYENIMVVGSRDCKIRAIQLK